MSDKITTETSTEEAVGDTRLLDDERAAAARRKYAHRFADQARDIVDAPWGVVPALGDSSSAMVGPIILTRHGSMVLGSVMVQTRLHRSIPGALTALLQPLWQALAIVGKVRGGPSTLKLEAKGLDMETSWGQLNNGTEIVGQVITDAQLLPNGLMLKLAPQEILPDVSKTVLRAASECPDDVEPSITEANGKSMAEALLRHAVELKQLVVEQRQEMDDLRGQLAEYQINEGKPPEAMKSTSVAARYAAHPLVDKAYAECIEEGDQKFWRAHVTVGEKGGGTYNYKPGDKITFDAASWPAGTIILQSEPSDDLVAKKTTGKGSD